MNGRQMQGMAMMITVLGIVVVPGVVVNNLQNNGVIQPYGSNCTAADNYCETCNASMGTCVLTAQTGCTVSATYCQLQGSSIAFLNSCSPFTNILTLNFVGFVSSFFTNCNNAVSQTVQQPIVGGVSATTVYTFSQCSPLSGQTAAGVSIYAQCFSISPAIQTSWGTIATNQAALTISFNTPGGACPGASNWNGVLGNATVGSVPTAATACLTGFIPQSGCTNVTCLTVVEMTGSCLGYGDYYSVGNSKNALSTATCTALSVNVVNSVQAAGGGGPISSSNLFGLSGLNLGVILSFLLSLLGGVLLIFVGLGIGGSVQGSFVATGGAVSVQPNPQGSKLAQTFGIALVIWSPLYSEFSTWFTSGYLPYGLDGAIGIIGVAVIAFFFIGAWMVSQTGTAATQ